MGSLSKSLTRSPSLFMMKKTMEQDVVTEKQGIVTVLGPSDSERTKAASLRRTLSADMSSKRWLAQNGFSPMKKIASSEELGVSADMRDNSSSSSEDEDHYQDQRKAKFHTWSSIDEQAQRQKNKAEAAKQQPGQADIWSSIVCQKANEEEASKVATAAPYIHPLVKKQSSALTKKSLQVCTESLGSETGSEGFSSYPTSETSDIEVVDKDQQADQAVVQQQEEKEKEKPQRSKAFDENEFRAVKYNSAASKKLPSARSSPPPLSSLSGCDGVSVHMRTHRDNGRLVLEAVSIPSPNNFRAERHDGRLVLTFLNATPSSCEAPKCEEVADEEEKFREEEFEENVNFEEGEEEKDSEKSDGDDVDVDEDEDEEEESDEVEKERKENGIKRKEIVMEEAPRILTSRVANAHRLALMMNKPIGLANKTHGWINKFNQVVKYGGDEEEVEVVEPTPVAKSLPPRPGSLARLIPKPLATTKTAAAAASFNAYEYYWRTKPTTAALNPLPPPTSQSLKNNGFMSKNQLANERQQLLVLRGNKGDHLLPFSKGCKEPRRSLLFWEPYCIATS
ncbi:protein FAF-like, chloroplastic [Pyrus x bretschneideri]|uniref:protein FAF-like, chloroplastic n=1 Tax=Pyrus x bretschneideri TaxID=225117 RepID=UPI0005110A9E|nr:protein FAF-like, chloroplastic [Pyrus x bretschneideri]